MELKEDDLVLCTVAQIEGATVFVQLESGEKGSIAMSEIAAGRIRNLREYVVPNKKIVCKVLKKHADHIELSLRRVTAGERDELLEKYKKERTSAALLKAVLKNSESTMGKILHDMPLADFIAKAKADIKSAAPYLTKEEAAILEKSLSEKRDKEKIAKATVSVKSFSPAGINDLRNVLSAKSVQVHYLGSGNFSVSSSAHDFKEARHNLDSALKAMEKAAKEKKVLFEVIGEK